MKLTQTFGAVLIVLFLGIMFHHHYINEFPSHTHAWTQSDRYALALGFVNNDLNFFKPETFSLLKNDQDPGNWKFPSEESITAVDFPLHDYIPAVFMKIVGDCSPWIFRLYILLFSFIGLFYLFKLSLLWTDNFYKSIFILVFAATSPVFVYYQGGFLPTIPSLASSIIGVYFYSKYLFTNKNKHFNFCILFLSIAALSRTTFAIPLIALFGLELLRVLRKNSNLKSKIAPVAISVMVILFYLFYNNYLRAKYGAIFLNYILPASSFQDAVEIIRKVKENWSLQYFTSIHYIVFTLSFLSSIFFIISKRQPLQKERSVFLSLIIIIFIGCIAFSVLTLRQFVAHDYYFLDTFYLPFILLLIMALSIIPIKNGLWNNFISIITILIFSIPVIISSINSQKERRVSGYWDKTAATINNFRNSESFLDSIGVSSNSKILVIDAHATNIPLILMNKKGYPIILITRENIQKSFEWDYDYIAIQNEFFLSDVYTVYPEIISRIEKIADNGRISICIHHDSSVDQTLIGFLGLEDTLPVFESIMTYDTNDEESWQNTQSTAELSFSGNKSGVLTREMKFGLTYKTKELTAITESSRTLLFSSYFLRDGLIDCELVISIIENEHNTYYKTQNLNGLLKSKNKWEKVNLLFQLPHVQSDDYEFALYIWNKGENALFIDDFEFKIY